MFTLKKLNIPWKEYKRRRDIYARNKRTEIYWYLLRYHVKKIKEKILHYFTLDDLWLILPFVLLILLIHLIFRWCEVGYSLYLLYKHIVG